MTTSCCATMNSPFTSTELGVGHERSLWCSGKGPRPDSRYINLTCSHSNHHLSRFIETGLESQVIQGSNLRQRFADTPPSVNNNRAGPMPGFQPPFDPYSPPGSMNSRGGYPSSGAPQHMRYPNQYPHQMAPPPRYPQGIGREEILMVSDDRVLALRPTLTPTAGPQRYMSDNASMRLAPP